MWTEPRARVCLSFMVSVIPSISKHNFKDIGNCSILG